MFSHFSINMKYCCIYSPYQSLVLLPHPFLDWRRRPLFSLAAMFFFVIIIDKWETREEESRGACVFTSSPLPSPPSFLVLLHLSVFLSDIWQPVGYSGHASPSADMCQLTWENTHFEHDWLTRAAARYLRSLLFLSVAQTHYRTHYGRCRRRSVVVVKTCNGSFTEGL